MERKQGNSGVQKPGAPDETWNRIASPGDQAQIIIGAVNMLTSMCIGPREAGEMLSRLDTEMANSLAFALGGTPDGETIRLVGEKLSFRID